MKSVILLATAVATLIVVPAIAQEIAPALPVCTEDFAADYDQASNSFLEVGVAIDSKADDHMYRTSLVTALNSCHAFVEKHVQVDPVTGSWVGQACTRAVDAQVQTLEPNSHKAECEYLQRLLNRND